MINLAQIQVGLNMTQAEMANFLDVSIPTYRKLVNDCGELQLHQADKIVKLYNSKQPEEKAKISLDDLLF